MVGRKHEPAENRMLRARLIIDLAYELMLIVDVSAAECDFTAGITRFRQACGDFHSHGTELRGINAVVYKGSSQRNRAPCVACRRGKSRKVSGQHCGCGYELTGVSRILTKRRALISAEEEQLVLDDCAAARAAELIALQ